MVYVLSPDTSLDLTLDMAGSSYDTKIWIWDTNLDLIACNDDYYPDYTSRIDVVHLEAGATYYVVIDGYGGDHGDYLLRVTEYEPCVLECPSGAELEGEPPLVDGYVDTFNSGCGSSSVPLPFGVISQPVFCGVSGWYLTADGASARDTDWFELVVPADGFLEIVGDASQETYMFELGPQDCGAVGVVQSVIIGPCHEGIMMIPGAPGSVVWFWIGPTMFDGPVNEYGYVLYVNPGSVATQARSWSSVKAMFNE
ncbi:MAG: hypothetical protein R3D98_04545 [Candidatus Krumholzibacteriia bacterium]